MEGSTDLLVVQPTGFGKSLCFLIPGRVNERFMHGKPATVVVVPLVALLADLRVRAETAGVSFVTWEQGKDARDFWMQRLIFVSLENATSYEFRNFLQRSEDRIGRIVLDECHLYLSSSYRKNIERIFQIRSIPAQLVLLSATVPSAMEGVLLNRFNMITGTKVFRSSTARPELSYRVIIVESTVAVRDAILARCENETSSSTSGKIIVYCPAVRMVEEITDFLGANNVPTVSLIGSLSEAAKTKMLYTFKSGGIDVMVATTAFSYGVDVKNVRQVIHYGYAHSMIDYAQETGRAARDGSPSVCEVITCNSLVSRAKQLYSSDVEKIQVLDYIMNKSKHCRRAVLSYYLDGQSTACNELCQLCDVCSSGTTPNNFAQSAATGYSCGVVLPKTTDHVLATLEDASNVTNTLQKEMVREATLLPDYLKELDTKCVFQCAAVGKLDRLDLSSKHSKLGNCRCHPDFHWISRCFKCGSGSCYKPCKLKPLIERQVATSQICAYCYLPGSCDSVLLHDESTWGKSSCVNKDRIWPLCLFLFYKKKEFLKQIGAISTTTTIEAYVGWLVEKDAGLPNAARVFCKWCESVS